MQVLQQQPASIMPFIDIQEPETDFAFTIKRDHSIIGYWAVKVPRKLIPKEPSEVKLRRRRRVGILLLT